MDFLWKCATLGIIASLLGLALRKEREEQALLLGLAAAALIFVSASSLKELSGLSKLGADKVKSFLKSLGLALLGRFSASLCRDAGQASAAQAVELASACAILCVSLPLLQSLLELVFAYT